MEKFSDKMAVLQVLGGLIRNPLLFINKEYKLTEEDFPEQFHKIVYSAVEHLAAGGLEKITPIEIDQWLAPYPVQYKVFCDNNGMSYVAKASASVDESGFLFYYTKLKKYSLLNKMREEGFDVSPLYDASLVDPKRIAEMQAKFDEMSIADLVGYYESKVLQLKSDFCSSAQGVEECGAGEGLLDLIASYEKTPEFGVSMETPKMTTVCRGRRLKKFYIESAAQGVGKSRRAAGEACHLAIPQFYNTVSNRWEKRGLHESVLLISTELEAAEVQTMFLAYVSGVPEHHILDGRYVFDEKERVVQAAKYIAESRLYFVQITDFDVDDIENLIKKYHYLHGVQYVFYDYLSTSMKVIAGTARKARIGDLKEYQILNLFGQRLKVLCNTLNIHIQTATPLSGDWTTSEADQQLLRGAKSLADQPDIGSILLPLRESDKPIVEAYASKGFEVLPNLVLHVYKTRRSGYNNIRLYLHFDYATCRLEDCFATDHEGRMINIEDTNIEKVLDDTATPDLPEAAAFVF